MTHIIFTKWNRSIVLDQKGECLYGHINPQKCIQWCTRHRSIPWFHMQSDRDHTYWWRLNHNGRAVVTRISRAEKPHHYTSERVNLWTLIQQHLHPAKDGGTATSEQPAK